MRKIMIVFCLFMTGAMTGKGQTANPERYPQVGDTLENYVFTDVANYHESKLSTADFRGKWLILDTWTTNCGACIESFPKMEVLDREFAGKVKVVMVGAMKYSEIPVNPQRITSTKTMFKHFKDKYKLEMTFAFDTVLLMKFGMLAVPHVMVIDPQGFIRAITSSIDHKQLSELIGGKNPYFIPARTLQSVATMDTYDPEKPFLTNGIMSNGGNDTSFLFRSLLRERGNENVLASGIRFFAKRNPTVITNGRVELLLASLQKLYNTAYFGASWWEYSEPEYANFYMKPLVSSDIDSLFYGVSAKLYAYSLTVPRGKANPEYMMQVMQNDLKNYFGFKVYKSRKDMPVYYIDIVNPQLFKRHISRVKKSSEKKVINSSRLILNNYTLDDLSKGYLSALLHLDKPLFNAAVDTSQIDLNFEGDLLNEIVILKGLAKCGIGITEGKRNFEVIEISK